CGTRSWRHRRPAEWHLRLDPSRSHSGDAQRGLRPHFSHSRRRHAGYSAYQHTKQGISRGTTVYNAIGEIPGTDKEDEIVMLGGHYDSWHDATGATDNGIGSSMMLEAVRLLAALH